MLANLLQAEAVNILEWFHFATCPCGIHHEKSTLNIAIGPGMERHLRTPKLNLFPTAKSCWGQPHAKEQHLTYTFVRGRKDTVIYSFKPLKLCDSLCCSITIANLTNQFSEEFPFMCFYFIFLGLPIPFWMKTPLHAPCLLPMAACPSSVNIYVGTPQQVFPAMLCVLVSIQKPYNYLGKDLTMHVYLKVEAGFKDFP